MKDTFSIYPSPVLYIVMVLVEFLIILAIVVEPILSRHGGFIIPISAIILILLTARTKISLTDSYFINQNLYKTEKIPQRIQ